MCYEGAAKIVEEVWQGNEHFVTELTRIAQGTTFNAADTGGTFTGTMTFSGDDWRWTSWTYDISMSDGSGKLLGSGQLKQSGISTDKRFQSPDGVVRVVIRETPASITKSEFQQHRPQASE